MNIMNVTVYVIAGIGDMRSSFDCINLKEFYLIFSHFIEVCLLMLISSSRIVFKVAVLAALLNLRLI